MSRPARTRTDPRLRRLIASGLRDADSAETHAARLRRLGAEAAEGPTLRSQERFFKALGDATRLKMATLLAGQEMCVCEIAVALDLTQPNASHHLSVLERGGIVARRREGKWVLYRIASPSVAATLRGPAQ